jgi:hypothetical protein
LSVRRAPSLGFDMLRLEGALLLPDFLDDAAQGQASAHQREKHHVPRGLTLHDGIGRAFRTTPAQWKGFAHPRAGAHDAGQPCHLVRRPREYLVAGVRAQGTRRDPAADRSHGRVADPGRAGRALVEGALMRRFMEVAQPKLWARAVQEDV